MRTKSILSFVLMLMMLLSNSLFSQDPSDMQELGISAGGFTNFPANQNYLKENINVFCVAPYLRTGQHEFSAGITYPLQTKALFFNDYNIDPRLGAVAGYKFYVFNVFGRENLFIHYSFQYLRFMKAYTIYYNWSSQPYSWTETDTYINNVIGLGYNLFFDTEERFSLFYTLDYVISQTGYKLNTPGVKDNPWAAQYIWNNISTGVGLSFKITSLKKEKKKTE